MKYLLRQKIPTLAIIFFAVSFNTFAEKHFIKIATVGPMSGQYETFGKQMKAGAEMAVNEINANGGVNGAMLELIIGDDACEPKQAVKVAKYLADQDVKFVAGHFCSDSSITASSIYNKEGIIQISPASTNPALTDERIGPYTHRVCGREDQQGQVAGQYLYENYKDKNVALVHDETTYGKNLANAVKVAFESLGGDISLFETYTYSADKKYSAIVSKLKENNIEVLYFGGYHISAGILVKQMRDQGMETQLISGDALVTLEYWEITGDAGEGTLMTFSPEPNKDPANIDVIKKFEDAGINTKGYVLYTYAAIQSWAEAAKAASSNDSDLVLKALKFGSFDTVLGSLSFDDKGDVNLPSYVWYIWKKGSYDYL